MTNIALVTVGITCYNNEQYVRQCLDSVLTQSYPNIEVIVVEDASSDNSLKIIREYSGRIRVISHSQNTGSLVQGRIDVINSARGEYIAHLDADDFWHSAFVEILVAEFNKDPKLDWVSGNTNLVNSGGFVTNQWNYNELESTFESCIKRGYKTASVPFPNNGVFKKSFLKKNNLTWYRLPNTLQGEDAITATKYLECRPRIKHIAKSLFNYRVHGANMSAKSRERVKMIIDLKEYYFNTFDKGLLFDDACLVNDKETSKEHRALTHYLFAKDLLEVKKEIKIPAAFCNDGTESELLGSLYLFDNPITHHAQSSLEHSSRYKTEIEQLLFELEQIKLITEGRRKLLVGDLSDSEKFFSKALSRNSREADALCGLGESGYLKGNLDKSEEFTVEALQVAPNNARLLNNTGVLFSAKNDKENSIKAFLRSIKADPHNADSRVNFAEVIPSLAKTNIVSDELKNELTESLNWLSLNYPDHNREQLLVENWKLATGVVDKFRNKFSGLDKRIVLHQPENGALKYLMQSWCEVLNHMGIRTHMLGWSKNTREEFNKFNPDIFISVNEQSYLNQIDFETVDEWRSLYGMKYGQILSYDEITDKGDFLITFHRNPERHKKLTKSNLPLISLPFAANPLKHFMRPGRSIWDYFFVGTNSAFKKRETESYLTPILKNHNGILAGVNWNCGLTELTLENVPLYYNFAKICPNYHVTRQIEEYNEVNERAFVIPACGGFQLVDNPMAMKECFTDDEMAVALSPHDYRDKFIYYLENEDKRIAFTRKGMQRVFREHTLFHVLARFAEFIEQNPEHSKMAKATPTLVASK